MFIYENKNKELCLTFKDDQPVKNPEFIINIDDAADQLYINGQPIVKYDSQEITSDVKYETAVVIDKPVAVNIARDVTISIPEDTDGSGVYHVTKGGSLVIDGEGVIDGVGKNDYNMAIWADGGNVTINGGKITNIGATATVDPAHFDLIYAKNGSVVVINGGYFECQTPKWTLNLNDKLPGKIIVRGGTFVGFDPSRAETEPGGLYNFVDNGYKVVKEDNLYTVVKA